MYTPLGALSLDDQSLSSAKFTVLAWLGEVWSLELVGKETDGSCIEYVCIYQSQAMQFLISQISSSQMLTWISGHGVQVVNGIVRGTC